MPGIKRRFVDSHFHLWDAKNNPWYNFPDPDDASFNLGLKRPFPLQFALDDYRAAVASVHLEKCVHVSALTVPKNIEEESMWVGQIAAQAGIPNAIIGTLNTDLPISTLVAMLDHETTNPVYKGIRLLGGIDYDSILARDLFSLLERRKLVYDLVASPGGIRNAAKGLAPFSELVIVLEHAGWPHGTDDSQIADWRAEMADLASMPNTYCKLSGMGMIVHRTDVVIFRKIYDTCIELFGANRCMFGTNFPVDLSYGSGSELLSLFEQVAQGYSADEAEQLFAGTAERAYRI